MISYEEFCGLLPAEFQSNVSRETFLNHILHFQNLEKWQKIIQLVSHSTLKDYWLRHVIDSLQLNMLYPGQYQWADMGSGGGFPGLTLAIHSANISDFKMHLIESNAKKAAFLQDVIRQSRAPAVVHCRRLEEGLLGYQFDHLVISARALADLPLLLKYAHIIGKSAKSYECVFLKSNELKDELTRALEYWRFDYAIHPSLSDPRGCILSIKNIQKFDR